MFNPVNPFNPPLDRKKAAQEHEAKRAAMDMIAQMLLSSDTFPEAHKIGLRIAITARQLADKIMDQFCKYATPLQSLDEAEAVFPQRAEVLEYLQLVGAGLDSFLETHPPCPNR